MIKVGIIGYGFSATIFHLPFLESSTELEFVAISTSRPDEVKLKHPRVSTYDTPEALIVDSGVDLVVITTPNIVHYSLAKLCLKKGLHVVLEKPMVTTSVEAKELVALAKEKSLILSVFHNRRWDGDFLTIKILIDNNSIGDVRFFESHFDRFRPTAQKRWREVPGVGAGIWFDLGPHLVDQAVCLFGVPKSVTARCLPMRDGSEVADYFHVLLHYENLEVVLHASLFSAGPNTRFRLEGTGGSYVKQGLDPQEDQLKSGMLPTASGFGVESEEHFGTLYYEENYETSTSQVETEVGCYQEFYSQLALAINGDGKCPVSGEEVLSVVKIIEFAEISSKEGRTIAFK